MPALARRFSCRRWRGVSPANGVRVLAAGASKLAAAESVLAAMEADPADAAVLARLAEGFPYDAGAPAAAVAIVCAAGAWAGEGTGVK